MVAENDKRRKLTNDQVREIRAKHAAGTHTITSLSIEYSVDWGTIKAVVSRRTFKDLD